MSEEIAGIDAPIIVEFPLPTRALHPALLRSSPRGALPVVEMARRLHQPRRSLGQLMQMLSLGQNTLGLSCEAFS